MKSLYVRGYTKGGKEAWKRIMLQVQRMCTCSSEYVFDFGDFAVFVGSFELEIDLVADEPPFGPNELSVDHKMR